MAQSQESHDPSNKHIGDHQLDTTIRKLWQWAIYEIRPTMYQKSIMYGCSIRCSQTTEKIFPPEKIYGQPTQRTEEKTKLR